MRYSRTILRNVARLAVVLATLLTFSAAPAAELEQLFRNPPETAKPWTYWFWINGNITKEGITADLEAMSKLGIGGVLIMEVANPKSMAPVGPVAFASPQWRELFKHMVSEAARLGIKVNMNNDAGWCGSGGPWITPELSMQKLVATNLNLTGPQHFDQILPLPKTTLGFYRDVKLLVYPTTPRSRRIPVNKDRVLDLSDKMTAEGKLSWDAPPGNWTIMRIGCTTTGAKNKPSPVSGEGLECDKFSSEAMKVHFDGLIAKLADDVGPQAGKTFVSTHIDSWEVGSQNWTPRMAEEFRRRRGYDLTPWLINVAGGPGLESADETQRFRRDYKRTSADLLLDTSTRTLKDLAQRRGLQLSIEAYGTAGFIDPLAFGAEADVPMAEFWIARWGAWHLQSPRLMGSVGHIHGKPIVGAESFTSWSEHDQFTEHPYSVKAIGDWAFCEGINRFVFHRTALNPWPTLAPGMGFAGYGWHMDREQTWWEPGKAFIQYLTRCQALLQEGQFVADVCRVIIDGENDGQRSGMTNLVNKYEPMPVGYNYDYISDRSLLTELSVKDGRLVTRSGMSYRLLQLPKGDRLTPEVTRKLRDLVHAGAVLYGPPPERSPSLQDYPRCDEEVVAVAKELWGDCDGKTAAEHAFGAGRVVWGQPIKKVLDGLCGAADLAFVLDPPVSDESIQSVTLGRGVKHGNEDVLLMPTAGLNWIHRRAGGADIYFVANPQHRDVHALCTFRVQRLRPELWDPITGEQQTPAVFRSSPQGTTMPLHLGPAGSTFVVFRQQVDPARQIVEVKRGDTTLFGGEGKTAARLPRFWTEGAKVRMQAQEPGRYEVTYATGAKGTFVTADPPAALTLRGPWEVRFPSGRGAPAQARFAELTDWSTHGDTGIRYFSGTATYATEFDWQPSSGARNYRLDLGDVKIMAAVRVNGKDAGVLWKPPFTVEVRKFLKAGRNKLEVKVTNLWPNRLIGDEQYPDDCTADGSWKTGPIPAWPEWLLKHQPRPEPHRVTFTTWKYYTKDSPLLPSGLLGPVRLIPERD